MALNIKKVTKVYGEKHLNISSDSSVVSVIANGRECSYGESTNILQNTF